MSFSTRFARFAALLGIAASLAACAGAPNTALPAANDAVSHAASGNPALSLAAFHGAIPPYVAALEASGKISGAPARKSWLDRAAFDRTLDASRDVVSGGKTYNYVVYASGGRVIDIYQSNTYEPQNPNPPIIGQIALPHSPEGLAVDRNQNLYAIVYSVGIEEFTPASMPNPVKTYIDPYGPQGIAVGPDGTLYAANTAPDSNGNIGISVFPSGSTTQSKLLTDPSFYYALYPTVDIKGNVYLVYADKAHTNLGSFGVFKAGSSAFTPIPLANNLYQAEFDANGDLLAADPNTASIDTYPNGSSSPTSSLVTESNSDFFLFDQTYARDQVFTEPFNSANGLTGGPILQFTYPQGIQLDTISHGANYLFGVVTAPQPPLPPAYSPAVGAGATPAPVTSTTPSPCTNGAATPTLDVSGSTLFYSAAVQCSGPGVPYNISATATLFNGDTHTAIQSFSGGAQGANYYKQVSIPCPGIGSYYTVVTSNVGATVQSATVTSTGC